VAGGHYAAAWGSSFSAAVVAGGAALLIDGAIAPGSADARVEAAVVLDGLRQAQWLGPDLGSGRIDLESALMLRNATAVR